MQIDSKNTVAGVPILQVRRFLRETMRQTGWTQDWLKQTLHVSTRQANRVITQLVADRYIEPSPDGNGAWRNTSNGNALAGASAAKPLLRQSAQEKLDQFLNRVRLVNSPECEFAYWVGEVILFGSMLTQKARISDIDVSVRLDRKYEGEVFSRAADLRAKIAARNGRSFKNIVERICWAEFEVRLFLKNRCRSISMVEWNEKWLVAQRHEVIYRRE